MENEIKMLKYEFSYTDEFDQETRVNFTISSDIFSMSTALELLVEQFKKFMLAAGFHPEHVNMIDIIED